MTLEEKQYIVETFNLTKRYGNITAVDCLNLQIEKGTIFGLLGPNGAGKTTTILMILGLTEPSEGYAQVAGYDTLRNPLVVKSMVGYLPDNVGFYQDLTGYENLHYTAALNGLNKKEAEKRIKKALELVGMQSVAERKVGEYSRGMCQRLGIADLLVKDPPLIILDEPTSGIDPEGVRELLDLIKALSRNEGRTILISSHLLHQIQQICDQVGIFVEGKLIAKGSISELGNQLTHGEQFQLELQAEPYGQDLIQLCRNMPEVADLEINGHSLVLHCTQDIRAALTQKLLKENFTLLHLHLRDFSLDDIYQRYFQKEGYHVHVGN